MQTVLGLDIGSASIGWSLVQHSPTTAEDATQGKIIACGVRVFPEGVDRDKKGGEVSKNASRRETRQMARQGRRRASRMRRMRELLAASGLLPANQAAWPLHDPYALRAAALDSLLTNEQLGILLYHLAQRRGFRGSRASLAEDGEGVVYGGISDLQEAMKESGARTLGEHLHRLRMDAAKKGEQPPRVRKRYTERRMYLAEYEAVADAQARLSHPAFSPKNPKLRADFKHIIFYQRPLKPSDELIGFCELEPKQRRAPLADRVAQRFRIEKELNNLRVIDERGGETPLTTDQRGLLRTDLLSADSLTFDKLRRRLGLLESQRFNLERGGRKAMLGMRTDATFRGTDVMGDRWDALSEDHKDRIVTYVLNHDDVEEVEKYALDILKLSPEAARCFSKVQLVKGYSSLSLRAMRAMLPFLERGYFERDKDHAQSAIHLAGYTPLDERKPLCLAKLNPPASTIGNPLVRSALCQLYRLVNAVVKEYGKPDAIHIELAREVQGGPEQRKQASFDMRDREARRTTTAARIREIAPLLQLSRDAIDRYLLWDDQRNLCAYTGKPIPENKLFSVDVEIDHVLPYSRSLDDSFANKVVCFRVANQGKGQRTPAEWLTLGTIEHDEVLQRMRHLSTGQRGKFRKLSQETCEIDGFIARQLTDTAYATREAAAYLRDLGVPVVCVKGQVTAALRERWGLNTVLRDDGMNLKNREDHRHHAVDAIVIALTTRSRLQALATQNPASLRIERRLARTEQKAKVDKVTGELIEYPQPWSGFRAKVEDAINEINVSHRSRRKVRGQLHEETVYGRPTSASNLALAQSGTTKGATPREEQGYTCRKPLESLNINEIRRIVDPIIRQSILERLAGAGLSTAKKPRAKKADAATAATKNASSKSSKAKSDEDVKIPKDFWKQPLFQMKRKEGSPADAPIYEPTHIQVKSVKITKTDKTIRSIGVRFPRLVKPGSTHHVCIFEGTDDAGETKRTAVWCSLYEAVQRLGELHRRKRDEPGFKHPGGAGVVHRDAVKDAQLLLSLCPGDMVLLTHQGEQKLCVYTTGASTSNQMWFVDARDARKSTATDTVSKQPNTLHCQKVNVDLLGRIRRAND